MKVNLGCGPKPQEGYINTDLRDLEGVDRILDINKLFPFASDTVDEYLANEVLEHCEDLFFTMEEIWRTLKPGGQLKGRVPWWHTRTITHPDHRYHFDLTTFDFFAPGKYSNFYTDVRFKLEWHWLEPTRLGKLIPGFVRHKAAQVLGEVYSRIHFTLIKVNEQAKPEP